MLFSWLLLRSLQLLALIRQGDVGGGFRVYRVLRVEGPEALNQGLRFIVYKVLRFKGLGFMSFFAV